MARSKKQDLIDRLIRALAHYDKRDPSNPAQSRRVFEEIRYQFRIGEKTMHTALLMRAGGINAGGAS